MAGRRLRNILVVASANSRQKSNGDGSSRVNNTIAAAVQSQ